MKLLIDISDEHYRNICKRAEYFGKRSIVLAPHEKAIVNGIPFEDIKVEIQNTILEQTYEKGQIDKLEAIKTEFEDKILLNQTVAIQIIDNHIAELKGDNDGNNT